MTHCFWGALIACSYAVIVVLEFRDQCSLCRAKDFKANITILSQRILAYSELEGTNNGQVHLLTMQRTQKNHTIRLISLSKCCLNTVRLSPVTISLGKKMEESERLLPVDK